MWSIAPTTLLNPASNHDRSPVPPPDPPSDPPSVALRPQSNDAPSLESSSHSASGSPLCTVTAVPASGAHRIQYKVPAASYRNRPLDSIPRPKSHSLALISDATVSFAAAPA